MIAYDAIRDDGQTTRFVILGGSIVAPPGVTLRLQHSAGGFALTDTEDSIETFSVTGQLLSVRTHAGVTQTMSYDAAGRLSMVSDSSGHSLMLGYDTQGRLTTLTRQ